MPNVYGTGVNPIAVQAVTELGKARQNAEAARQVGIAKSLAAKYQAQADLTIANISRQTQLEIAKMNKDSQQEELRAKLQSQMMERTTTERKAKFEAGKAEEMAQLMADLDQDYIDHMVSDVDPKTFAREFFYAQKLLAPYFDMEGRKLEAIREMKGAETAARERSSTEMSKAMVEATQEQAAPTGGAVRVQRRRWPPPKPFELPEQTAHSLGVGARNAPYIDSHIWIPDPFGISQAWQGRAEKKGYEGVAKPALRQLNKARRAKNLRPIRTLEE